MSCTGKNQARSINRTHRREARRLWAFFSSTGCPQVSAGVSVIRTLRDSPNLQIAPCAGRGRAVSVIPTLRILNTVRPASDAWRTVGHVFLRLGRDKLPLDDATEELAKQLELQCPWPPLIPPTGDLSPRLRSCARGAGGPPPSAVPPVTGYLSANRRCPCRHASARSHEGRRGIWRGVSVIFPWNAAAACLLVKTWPEQKAGIYRASCGGAVRR